MKNLTTLFIGLIIINLAFAQTVVPNGDFEAWTDQYHIPNWDGLNYDGGILNFHTFTRTDDAHTGNYAAQVETINHNLIGDLPGMAFTGNIDFDPTTFEYNFNVGVPVEGRPTSLKGYFKYSPSGTDTMAIVIGMFRWNAAQNDLDSIGGGFFFTGNATSSYTEFEAPIQYFDPTLEADTMYIMMFSSLDTYHVGSVLKVDDLTLNYGTVGMIEGIDETKISIYPNPASDNIKIELPEEANQVELLLTDITGRNMLQQTVANNATILLPENIMDGIYFASLRHHGITIKTFKIFVKR